MSPCLPARLPRPHFAARPAHVRKTPLCARARAPMCVIGYSDCSARLMMADIRRRRCCEYVKRYRSMRRDDDGRRYRRTLAGRWAAFKETIFIGKTPRKSDRRDDGSEINGPLSPPDITEYGRTGRARRLPVIQLPCTHWENVRLTKKPVHVDFTLKFVHVSSFKWVCTHPVKSATPTCVGYLAIAAEFLSLVLVRGPCYVRSVTYSSAICNIHFPGDLHSRPLPPPPPPPTPSHPQISTKATWSSSARPFANDPYLVSATSARSPTITALKKSIISCDRPTRGRIDYLPLNSEKSGTISFRTYGRSFLPLRQ